MNLNHYQPFKTTIILLLSMLLFSACSPSPSAIETAVAQTQASWTPTPAPTSTPIPTATPQPTATPEHYWKNCILGKSITTQYYESLLEKQACIYGVITDKKEFGNGGMLYNIYPEDKSIHFLIVVNEPELLQELIPGAPGILTTADIGECIVVVGYPLIFEDGGSQFIGADVRDISQLVSELGAENSTVQEITTFCE